MKKVAINGVMAGMVLGLVLSGCGDDRSHPKKSINTNSISYANPTAVIDINSTSHRALLSKGTDVYRYSNANDPFVLDGVSSHDNDERGDSIVAYDWNITSTFSNNCLDINQTGTKAIVKVCDEALNDGEINATLVVTDDEGKKDTTTRIIKIN